MKPMSYECAVYIVATAGRLVDLWKEADKKGADTAGVGHQLDRLKPYLTEANQIYIQRTDDEFKAAANDIQEHLNRIKAATADIKKINEALTGAANIINKISGLLGVVL